MLLRMFLGSIISVTMAATNGQQEHGPPHPPPSPSSPPPPLLLVSFDGFRADYLWQYPMPNLELLYRGGVLVEELTNIFSTKTFPNHYSLVTGLYAESHGILASNMYDAAHNKTFSLAHDQDPFWWSQALPLWLTALDSNYSTAAAMWPGSDVAIGNRTATHFLPYNASMPFAERLAKVSSWLRGSEQEKTVAEDDNPLDLSMSSIEASPSHPVDSSFVPLFSTSSSSSSDIPDILSAAGTKHWSEKKWIVNESKLMQLFTTCQQCGVLIGEEDKKVTTSGTRIHIKWSCMKGHSGEWESCSQLRGMPENNLLVASSILFTGSTFTEIFDWAELLNLQIPKKTTFYSLQSTYLIPVIEYAYRDHHEEMMSNLQLQTVGGGISICGDGRSDSPGFSAKYTTYSFMSNATQEIIMVDLVQVTEATSSPAMETLGFRRGLDRLLQAGVRVDVITTDRSPSIRKLMRETYSDIQHQFDPWHVAKGLKKKLTAAANNKKNIDLQPWLKAITNHLWWSCQSCGGDAEELKRRWKSVLHHICGIHRWEEDGQEKTCYHRDLTEEQQRRKKWLQTDSAAFQTLSDHVLNKNLLKDLNHMTLFQHTGALEVYHSAMLKYTEKRLHFAYSSMKARTLLSVMDNNKNVGRQQATTSDGTPRYNLVFPKQSKRWVARKRYEPTRQTFRKDLVERVLERRMDPTVKFADPHFYIQQPATIPDNIATTPRPDKDQSIAEHVSRFKT